MVRVAGANFRVRTDDKVSAGIVALPIEQVWRALPAAFDSLGLAPTLADRATWRYGTEGQRLRKRLGGVALSRYFDCGATQVDNNADSYDVLLILVARLAPGAAGTTTVEVTMDVRARPLTFPQGYQPCDTKGTLDARLVTLIRDAALRLP